MASWQSGRSTSSSPSPSKCRRRSLRHLSLILLVQPVSFYWNNPVYHQICFATIQILSSARVIYLIAHLPPSSTHSARPTILRHVLVGLVIFIAAFAVWNVDNVLCVQLRRVRDALGAMGSGGRVAAWALQGHAWWHLGTGYGSYLVITGATCESATNGSDVRATC